MALLVVPLTLIRPGPAEARRAQVVLGRSKKDPKKVRALKVVYLQSPQMLEEPEHLEIMKR